MAFEVFWRTIERLSAEGDQGGASGLPFPESPPEAGMTSRPPPTNPRKPRPRARGKGWWDQAKSIATERALMQRLQRRR
jgi:hypothetical protein